MNMKVAGIAARRFRHRGAGGFPEVAYWQGKGYKDINPLPLSVKAARYLGQRS